MTNSNKTFKDLKDSKDLAKLYHASKEGHREERGGHRNLLKEAREEEAEEVAEDNKLLEETEDQLL